MRLTPLAAWSADITRVQGRDVAPVSAHEALSAYQMQGSFDQKKATSWRKSCWNITTAFGRAGEAISLLSKQYMTCGHGDAAVVRSRCVRRDAKPGFGVARLRVSRQRLGGLLAALRRNPW